jgi:lysozyme family protein
MILGTPYTVEQLAQLKDLFLYTIHEKEWTERVENMRQRADYGATNFVTWLAQEDRRPLLSSLEMKK